MKTDKIAALALALLLLTGLACTISVDLFNPPPLATPFPNRPASATPNILLPTNTPLIILPTVTPTLPPPTLTASAPALTAGQIKNGTFNIPGSDGVTRVVQFKDGKFETGSDPAAQGYASLSLGGQFAFGDLNGDGAEDAAAILGENYGGSGVFISVLAFLNQDGKPALAGVSFVDDRAMINALSINNGAILLGATIHGPNDAMCCPSQPATRKLTLWQNTLVLASQTSQTPTGAQRVITIETPASNAQVEKIFTVHGSVSIAPFENTLAYKIYIPGMADPFTQGPLTVSAPGPGAAGTFDLPLNFSAAGYTGPVRITLADISAADGSTLAQDTLFITIK